MQNVADAVAAFGEAEIVQRADAWQRIHREHQAVDELRAVVTDPVVIAGFEMTTGHIHRSSIYEWIQLRRRIGELWRGLRRVV